MFVISNLIFSIDF